MPTTCSKIPNPGVNTAMLCSMQRTVKFYNTENIEIILGKGGYDERVNSAMPSYIYAQTLG